MRAALEGRRRGGRGSIVWGGGEGGRGREGLVVVLGFGVVDGSFLWDGGMDGGVRVLRLMRWMGWMSVDEKTLKWVNRESRDRMFVGIEGSWSVDVVERGS